jgi:hypothetical protein
MLGSELSDGFAGGAFGGEVLPGFAPFPGALGSGSFATGPNQRPVPPCPLRSDGYRNGEPLKPTRRANGDIRSSLDHLIGGVQEFVWDAEAERLGGLKVDRELERRRLLDRQLGRIGAV